MMFVFGEVSDAIQETTMLVEDIVRSQVIEIVRLPFTCNAMACRRRSRANYMNNEEAHS